MDLLNQAKQKIIDFQKKIGFHTFFLITIPIVLTVLMYFTNTAEYKMFWFVAYFVIVLSIAFILKVYTLKESILFVVWMIVINSVVFLILLILLSYLGWFLACVFFLFSGPIFHLMLTKFKGKKIIREMSFKLKTFPRLLPECFSTDLKFNHSLNWNLISRDLLGQNILQNLRSQYLEMIITDFTVFKEKKYIWIESPKQLQIIEISPKNFVSIGISVNKEPQFLRHEQILAQLEIMLKVVEN